MWFGMIMPGHQRGGVALPGAESGLTGPIAAAPSCPMCVALEGDSDDAPPSSDPASGCAICFLKGVLHQPPAISLAPPPAELVGEACLIIRESATARPAYRVFHGLAPPHFSA